MQSVNYVFPALGRHGGHGGLELEYQHSTHFLLHYVHYNYTYSKDVT